MWTVVRRYGASAHVGGLPQAIAATELAVGAGSVAAIIEGQAGVSA
jgi:hypothetical protein